MTDFDQIAAEAEYFRLGAIVGLENGAEAISWADRQIVNSASPSIAHH